MLILKSVREHSYSLLFLMPLLLCVLTLGMVIGEKRRDWKEEAKSKGRDGSCLYSINNYFAHQVPVPVPTLILVLVLVPAQAQVLRAGIRRDLACWRIDYACQHESVGLLPVEIYTLRFCSLLDPEMLDLSRGTDN